MEHVAYLLDEYYDGELSPARCRQVEAHLEDCPLCAAQLGQLGRLSRLLAEVPVPDELSSAETFRSQVVLCLSRRDEARVRYDSVAWHLVPLLLVSALLALQALFAFSGLLLSLSRTAGWLGVNLGSLLPLLGAAEARLGSLLGLNPASVVTALGVALMVVLYFASVAVFLPYVGWVGTLLRTSRAQNARG
jgi:anti-sigma factor RsiW